ncbi:unnamed protein product, partial [Effrenium voratum]
VLAGFSQGGALSLYTGLRLPIRLAGVVCMSGYLPFTRTFATSPEAAQVPVLHCHGSADGVVRLDWAEAGAERLRQLAVPLEMRLYDMGHSACEEELDDVAEWIAERVKCLAVFVLSPLCVALFLLHPIRLSRAAVFVQSLVCSVYSLCFLVQITVWLLHQHWRPWYALTWSHAGVISDRKVDCLCGCEYSVSNHALFQLMMIAVTSLAKSLMVAMRCVKGLRRSQWANLITVLFS